jgi:benzoate 4-monooxygenase
MAILDSPIGILIGLGTVVLAVHILPWLLDPHGMRDVPGPFLAKFSDFWLGRVAALGHRSEVVHELHKRYGPLVRIAPNHVSVADPTALQIIYAHGNGSLKSNFYEYVLHRFPDRNSEAN